MHDAITSHETNLSEIILCAAQDRELDGHGDLTDIHLHTILRELYRNHAEGLITKEDAAKRKEQYVTAYKKEKQAEAEHFDAVKRWNDNIRKSDQARIEMRKSESLRDFAKAAAGVVELLTGDTGLVKMAETLPEVGF